MGLLWRGGVNIDSVMEQFKDTRVCEVPIAQLQQINREDSEAGFEGFKGLAFKHAAFRLCVSCEAPAGRQFCKSLLIWVFLHRNTSRGNTAGRCEELVTFVLCCSGSALCLIATLACGPQLSSHVHTNSRPPLHGEAKGGTSSYKRHLDMREHVQFAQRVGVLAL